MYNRSSVGNLLPFRFIASLEPIDHVDEATNFQCCPLFEKKTRIYITVNQFRQGKLHIHYTFWLCNLFSREKTSGNSYATYRCSAPRVIQIKSFSPLVRVTSFRTLLLSVARDFRMISSEVDVGHSASHRGKMQSEGRSRQHGPSSEVKSLNKHTRLYCYTPLCSVTSSRRCVSHTA